MGYRPDKKVYNLEFADHPGLEVSARSATLGEIKHIQKLKINLNEQDEEKQMEVFEFFAKKLIKWNIDHPELDPDNDGNAIETCTQCGLAEGADVPPTVTGMLCLDLDLIVAIITGWVFAVGRVTVPKELSLRSGGRNGPESSQMDGLTEEIMNQLETLQSPAKLPTPNFS